MQCLSLGENRRQAVTAVAGRRSSSPVQWGALKMQDKTLQDRTMTDKLAKPDFAGQDNDGQEKHHTCVEIKT